MRPVSVCILASASSSSIRCGGTRVPWASLVRTPVTLQTGLASRRSALHWRDIHLWAAQSKLNPATFARDTADFSRHSGYRGLSISARVCFYFRFAGEWLLNSAKASKHQVASLWMKALLSSKKVCTEKAACNNQLSQMWKIKKTPRKRHWCGNTQCFHQGSQGGIYQSVGTPVMFWWCRASLEN